MLEIKVLLFAPSADAHEFRLLVQMPSAAGRRAECVRLLSRLFQVANINFNLAHAHNLILVPKWRNWAKKQPAAHQGPTQSPTDLRLLIKTWRSRAQHAAVAALAHSSCTALPFICMPLLAKIFNILRRVQKGARTLARRIRSPKRCKRRNARTQTHSSGGKSARCRWETLFLGLRRCRARTFITSKPHSAWKKSMHTLTQKVIVSRHLQLWHLFEFQELGFILDLANSLKKDTTISINYFCSEILLAERVYWKSFQEILLKVRNKVQESKL